MISTSAKKLRTFVETMIRVLTYQDRINAIALKDILDQNVTNVIQIIVSMVAHAINGMENPFAIVLRDIMENFVKDIIFAKEIQTSARMVGNASMMKVMIMFANARFLLRELTVQILMSAQQIPSFAKMAALAPIYLVLTAAIVKMTYAEEIVTVTPCDTLFLSCRYTH